MTDPIPTTVLSGVLGAGKTTLLNHLLDADPEYDVAVVVNDVGSVNVDAESVRTRVEDHGDVVELSDGCICCGIESRFEQSLVDLALNETFEYLLIEPSGISEPEPVVRTLTNGRAAGFYKLESVTTVVDARQFHDAFVAGNPPSAGERDDDVRPLSDLLADGIEFCDTIVLNKTDLVAPEEQEAVTEALRTLQPEAELRPTMFGQVDPSEVIGTGRFDLESVSGSSSWRRAIERHRHDADPEHGHDGGPDRDHDVDSEHGHDHDGDSEHGHDHDGDHDHPTPAEIYGVDSFVYDRRRPVHPARIVEAFESLPDGVLRVKGNLHVAGFPDNALTVSMAGSRTQIEVTGRWIASLPEEKRELHRLSRDPDWDEEYGDRKTELVVIGRGIDHESIERRFDECLLTEPELGADPDGFENPLPRTEGEEIRF